MLSIFNFKNTILNKIKMKLRLLLSLALTLFFFSSKAQKQKKEKIDFNYIQQPIIKLSSDWKYQVKLSQRNKKELELERVKLELDKKKAQKEYEKALEAYNNGKTVEKILLDEPVKRVVEDYFIGKIYDEYALGSQYFNINGFSKTDSDANFTVEAILEGFSIMTEQRLKTSDGSQWYYSITYRNPVILKVYDEQSNNLIEYQVNAKVTTDKSDKFKSLFALEQNKIAILRGIEESSIRKSLTQATKYVNDQLGYVEKTKSIKFYTAKKKKEEYPELDKAITGVKRSLMMFKEDQEYAKTGLNKAISTWEKALESKDIDNKKARINKIITVALYLNTCYAYTLVNDYDKAMDNYIEAKLLSVGRFKGALKDFNNFFKDYKARNPID